MADPNVWIRAAMSIDGYGYYEMLLVYVDDIMIISTLGDQVAKQICEFYYIKEGSQGLPMLYLVADTETIHTEDGREIWTTSSVS